MAEAIMDKVKSVAAPSRTEFIVFACSALLGFCYVALRAALVPIVHDEAATFFHYIFTGNFWPGTAHWDANNHVLNSVLTWMSVQAFGEGLFALRLPNVLAYVLWAFATGLLARRCTSVVVRCSLIPALLFCSFVLDFFSLCRGYGLGLAFFLVAINAAIGLMEHANWRSFSVLLIASALAIWADLALLPALGLLISLAVVFTGTDGLRQAMSKPWNWVAVAVSAMLVYKAVLFAQGFSERGLLYHGSLDGFLSVTVKPLFLLVTGSDHWVWIASGVLLACAVLALGCWAARDRWRKAPVVLIGVVLVGLVAATVFMAKVLHINYPEDRAALQFVVLAIVAFAFAVDAIRIERPSLQWMAIALVFLPLRSAYLINVDRTLLWSEQSLPDALVRDPFAFRSHDTSFSLGLYHQHALVWVYAQRNREGTEPNGISEGFPDLPVDLILADERFTQQLDPAYQKVADGGHDGLGLYQRNPSLDHVPVKSALIEPTTVADEYINLPTPELDPLVTGPIRIAVELRVKLDGVAPCSWVVSTHIGDAQEHYAAYPVHYEQPVDGVITVRYQHVMEQLSPQVDRLACYLWNPEQRAVEVLEGNIRFDRIVQP
ncbi:MAG: hypothetical protein KA408_12680 [Flavobacteriales bacterium]|nr:hypothetical protein [Flavobacteriales bacterium]